MTASASARIRLSRVRVTYACSSIKVRSTGWRGLGNCCARRIRPNLLHVFFSAIGDAPESILYTTIDVSGDWRQWKVGEISEVLTPQSPYECLGLPNEPSEVGEIDRPARQLRDPAVFREDGRTYLFYTFCGEQGVAGAELTLVP